ncbi:MAG: protein kinase [Chloroflexota bacterium]
MALPEDTVLENRYRIERLLGQGGMGAIYRGFDTRLNRRVAIKENFFQTPQAIQQFEREAMMLADLTHPNLPRVGDHFSYEGRQYLVMDFVEGQDLWEMVKEQDHPLSESQALDYLIQVCGAVQYLHERNPPIIHRDIKPQNIKITPKGRAVLIDFGIAKMAEGGQRTSTGARGVTHGFSPLEQYAGSGTSPVSDVYSLGATLYAVLTGQKPPDSASRMVDEAKFVPPAKLNANLSERVSQAIEYAMQPKPADRPSSVVAWWQELEAIRDETVPARLDKADTVEDATVMAATAPVTPEPTAAPQPAPIATAPPVKSGPPWLLIGGAVVVVLVIVAIAFFPLSGGPTPTPTEPPTPTEEVEPEVDTEATVAVAIAATATEQAQVEALDALAATATAGALATDIPTLAPTDTPAPEPEPTVIVRILFEDDFSSNAKEWGVGELSNDKLDRVWDVSNGQLKLSMASNSDTWSALRIPNFSAKDFLLNFDAEILEQSGEFSSGDPAVRITFRSTDDSFYRVFFDNNAYRVDVVNGDDERRLVDWTRDSAIRLEEGVVNTFAILVKDSKISLFANGQEIVSFNDETVDGSGIIALGATLFEAGQSATIIFDNLVVTEVP